MTDEADLIAAIHADPDDNVRRLVYADYLDEHGTTDQQRARSEWIRLTCWDRKGGVRKPTGDRRRLAGEPAWLRENAHRLWPRLAGVGSGDGMPFVSFGTGRVSLSVKMSTDGGGKLVECVVNIRAERGITTRVSVPFVRAALLAPLAARDEPAAAINTRLPETAYHHLPTTEVAIFFRPFRLRGLQDVWRRLPGETRQIGISTVKAKVTPWSAGRPFQWRDDVSAALTAWARERANPLTMENLS